jgi:hypothetical protein
MVTNNRKNWRELCAEAAKEADSDKLLSLISQILQALEERDRQAFVALRRTGTTNEPYCDA